MTEENGGSGVARGRCSSAPLPQRLDLGVPDDFDASLTPTETESWESSDSNAQGFSRAPEELDDWPIDVADLREALRESEADIAAGRTFGEDEIRAQYGLPRRGDGP
ncbi:hypothetical protein [Mycolicibacterium cosmeticum]|uniref:hypothetical protein n=1 Tax=Mycolicibacterium cosmeticum TaxID=258533 RepID=UPI00320472A2